jgi:GWxTD domain-containing protein
MTLVGVCGGPLVPSIAGEQATNVQGERGPSALYDQALLALKKKNYVVAETQLRQLLTLSSRYQEPSGRSAWYQLGRALELQGDKLAAMQVMEEGRDSLRAAPRSDWYLMYDLARLYAENRVEGRDAEITELVYGVLRNSTPEQQPDLWQRLFHETAFLLDEAERGRLKRLLSEPGGRPGLLLLRFFRFVDPSPLTAQNEYLTVFFQRAAEARRRYPYALSPRGYDARGDIYVRLGPPYSIVSNHSGVRGEVGWAIYPYEVWFYKNIHPDLYYAFIRERGRSHYTLADGPESFFGAFYKGRRTFFNRQNVGQTAMYLRDEVYTSLAGQHEEFRRRLYELSNQFSVSEALEYAKLHFPDEDRGHAARRDSIAPPVVYGTSGDRGPLPVSMSMARFWDDTGKTRVEIYYGVPYEPLFFTRTGPEGYGARLHARVGIFNENQELVASDSTRTDCIVANMAATTKGQCVSQSNLVLDPGRYRLGVLRDAGRRSDRRGVASA